jgi:hypothetical protein
MFPFTPWRATLARLGRRRLVTFRLLGGGGDGKDGDKGQEAHGGDFPLLRWFGNLGAGLCFHRV